MCKRLLTWLVAILTMGECDPLPEEGALLLYEPMSYWLLQNIWELKLPGDELKPEPGELPMLGGVPWLQLRGYGCCWCLGDCTATGADCGVWWPEHENCNFYFLKKRLFNSGYGFKQFGWRIKKKKNYNLYTDRS